MVTFASNPSVQISFGHFPTKKGLRWTLDARHGRFRILFPLRSKLSCLCWWHLLTITFEVQLPNQIGSNTIATQIISSIKLIVHWFAPTTLFEVLILTIYLRLWGCRIVLRVQKSNYIFLIKIPCKLIQCLPTFFIFFMLIMYCLLSSGEHLIFCPSLLDTSIDWWTKILNAWFLDQWSEIGWIPIDTPDDHWHECAATQCLGITPQLKANVAVSIVSSYDHEL